MIIKKSNFGKIHSLVATGYGYNLKLFYDSWMSGDMLAQCLNECSTAIPCTAGGVPQGTTPFPVPKNKVVNLTIRDPYGTIHNIADHNRFTANLRVVGHTGLTRSFYNPNYDNAAGYTFEPQSPNPH